jgi:hypothetical protein
MVHANHGESIWRSSETFSELVSSTIQNKPKLLSVFCSNQNLTPNHQLRIEFVKKLKEHFGDQLDWFGNGFNPVATKRAGLSDYKYTIVLENQARFNIITEKIYDAFIERCFPFYWGAPNLSSYFDSEGFEVINVEDVDGAISIIENAISNDYYVSRSDSILRNREICLHELNFLNRMIDLAENISNSSSSESALVKLNSQSFFTARTQISHARLVNSVHRTLNQLDVKMDTNLEPFSMEFYKLLRYNPCIRFIRNLTTSLFD